MKNIINVFLGRFKGPKSKFKSKVISLGVPSEGRAKYKFQVLKVVDAEICLLIKDTLITFFEYKKGHFSKLIDLQVAQYVSHPTRWAVFNFLTTLFIADFKGSKVTRFEMSLSLKNDESEGLQSTRMSMLKDFRRNPKML